MAVQSTILIVDDQPIFRQGLRRLLEKEKDLRVIAEADDGQTAIDLARRKTPNLVAMNIDMSNFDSVEATRRILADCPDTKVVALSVYSVKQIVRDMIQAGASGFILKESLPEDMIAGIRTVLSGDVYLSKSISNILISDYKTLVSESGPAPDGPSASILYTKLYRPPIASHIVPRTRLIELLENGAPNPITLIAAAAGYGKSVLTSQWLNVSEFPGAWISLDESDNDLRVFLTYVLEAIRNLFPRQELKSKSLLQAAELPSVPVISRYLLNDLQPLTERFILALDDFHLIHNAAIHEFMDELLVHPSPVLHLALISRRDPPLSLTALRGRGMLNEITTSHLRFTVSETKRFLERFPRITVADETVQILKEKMEGWVTGLHLAALSIKDEADQKRLTAGLLETSHYVRDYLFQEVISHAPPKVRRHLLQTSILDRFCAPLCDALSAANPDLSQTETDTNGRDFIDWLIKTRLFVVPLDTTNQWFRYHHLFQDILQNNLKQRCSSEEIAELHLRACAWFERHDLIDEAIRHALAAGDVVRAAEIVEHYRHIKHEEGRWHVIDKWLAGLPAEIKRKRPALLMAEAWIAYVRFQMERIPPMLERAESLLDEQTAEPPLLGELDFFRGNLLYWQNEAEASIRYLENALARIPEKDTHVRSNTELILGLARHLNGQKELAIQAINDRIRAVDTSEGFTHAYLIAGLVFIHLLSGELTRAMAQAQRMKTVIKQSHDLNADAWSSYLQACAHLHAYELDRASYHFGVAARQRYILDTRALIDALAGLALAQQLMLQSDKAAETVDRLLEFAGETNSPQHMSVARSCKARLSLLQGDPDPAADWARSITEAQGPMELWLWLEAPSITRARVQIAVGTDVSLGKAIEFLRTIRHQSEACRFACQTIEVAVLQSLALEKLGRSDEGLKTLEEVVVLAEPGGWIRPFVEAGPPMADLLKRLHRQTVAVDYIDRILDAFPDAEPIPSFRDLRSTTDDLPFESESMAQIRDPIRRTNGGQESKIQNSPVEPLTNRELDVLELLAKRLQSKEIAEKLSISALTVKSHVRNIFQKLNAANRREAVEKAKDLGVL